MMATERSSGDNASIMRINFDNYISDFGTTITVTRRTETTDSMNRITSISESTSTINADIQYITNHDLMHLNLGDAEIGDGMLFVRYDADIELEDKITFNSIDWRIISQMEGELVKGKVIYKGYIIRRSE